MSDIVKRLREKCWHRDSDAREFPCPRCRQCFEAAAEIERLRTIVDTLPKTADGRPVIPGMTCWYMSCSGNVIEFPVNDWSDITTDIDDYGRRYYSTREAAKAAGGDDGQN